MPDSLLSYAREELLSLRRNEVKLARPARKAIFSHGLWLTRQERTARRLRECKQEVAVGRKLIAAQSVTRPSVKFGLLNAQSIGNKFVDVTSLIGENSYDVFLLTETWHTASEDTALRRCVPDGFVCIDQPRLPKNTAKPNHGGVAAVVSDRFRCKRLPPLVTVTSFESVCFSMAGSGSTVVVLLLYRPGTVGPSDIFFTELTQYLEVLALYKCQIIIAGDFNVHVEKINDPNAVRFSELVDSFDCVQHVPAVPTHRNGGTLDLIITKAEQGIVELVIDPPDIISDQSDQLAGTIRSTDSYHAEPGDPRLE